MKEVLSILDPIRYKKNFWELTYASTEKQLLEIISDWPKFDFTGRFTKGTLIWIDDTPADLNIFQNSVNQKKDVGDENVLREYVATHDEIFPGKGSFALQHIFRKYQKSPYLITS